MALAKQTEEELNKFTKTLMDLVKSVFKSETTTINADFKAPKEEGIIQDLKREVVFKGFDESRGLVYGIVYEPMIYDSHKHRTSSEEIEKAAHEYLPNSMLNIQHKNDSDLIATQAVIVESFIAPVDFQYENTDSTIQKGSWVLVTKIYDEGLKKALKDGVITGYSLEGTAFVVEENQIT